MRVKSQSEKPLAYLAHCIQGCALQHIPKDNTDAANWARKHVMEHPGHVAVVDKEQSTYYECK